ncbi:MAG: alpha/beta fold hydrolase [Gemmataceae bacterium]
MPHADIGGLRLFYQQTGQGPDVVLVHAVTGNLAVWMLTGLSESLGQNFRVTSYDLRGHGHSDVPAIGYTSADMAEDFRQLHRKLGLRPAFLVGHSFGGVVALHTASLYPDLVAGVIVADSYFPGLREIEPNIAQANIWTDLRTTFESASVELPAEVDLSDLFRVVAKLTPGQSEQLDAKLGPFSRGWLRQLPRLANTICGKEVFEVAGFDAARIAAVRQPVVALYDEHSPFHATCRYLEQQLPNCTVEIIPGAKHLALVQNPAAFADAVSRHLRRMASECISSPSSSKT